MIALDRIGQLDLRGEVYGEILLPPAVTQEVGPIFPQRWITVQAPTEPFHPNIDSAGVHMGEREAIASALQAGADPILLDDRPTRRLAVSLGLPTTGTVGVLCSAKQLGFLHLVRPLLDELRASGFRVNPRIVEQILGDVGETA